MSGIGQEFPVSSIKCLRKRYLPRSVEAQQPLSTGSALNTLKNQTLQADQHPLAANRIQHDHGRQWEQVRQPRHEYVGVRARRQNRVQRGLSQEALADAAHWPGMCAAGHGVTGRPLSCDTSGELRIDGQPAFSRPQGGRGAVGATVFQLHNYSTMFIAQ